VKKLKMQLQTERGEKKHRFIQRIIEEVKMNYEEKRKGIVT
jgi:hypothetical protein